VLLFEKIKTPPPSGKPSYSFRVFNPFFKEFEVAVSFLVGKRYFDGKTSS